jgi:hypothetical protein
MKMFLLVPAVILAAACGRDDSKKVDDALNADLSLAAQARPMDSVSAMERAYAAQQGLAPVGYAPAQQPVRTRVVYRDRPVYRSSGSSGTYSTARATPRVKHTKRDAAIGAAAGAAIGAVTSRDKLKGAVVGGVAGAVLGGVLGNNVDITKR